jgi:hypothetical protein
MTSDAQVCLATETLRGVERFATRSHIGEWQARYELLGLGLLAGALAGAILTQRERA